MCLENYDLPRYKKGYINQFWIFLILLNQNNVYNEEHICTSIILLNLIKHKRKYSNFADQLLIFIFTGRIICITAKVAYYTKHRHKLTQVLK